jgi:hypothetical protein
MTDILIIPEELFPEIGTGYLSISGLLPPEKKKYFH